VLHEGTQIVNMLVHDIVYWHSWNVKKKKNIYII
jgi:hypothetical protein